MPRHRLCCAAAGSSKAAEAKSCSQEVTRLAQVAAVWGQSPLEQNPYMQAALLLLDLHLPDEALQALDLCQGPQQPASGCCGMRQHSQHAERALLVVAHEGSTRCTGAAGAGSEGQHCSAQSMGINW
jgi:hypothetical protein